MSVQRATRLLGANGLPIQDIENTLVTTSYPLGKQIAEGSVPGAKVLHISGYLPNINDVAKQTVYPGGGVYPFPSDAGNDYWVVSTSEEDLNPSYGRGAGAGVQTIQIHYLDPTGDEQSLNVELNGIIPVKVEAVPLGGFTPIRRVQFLHTMILGTPHTYARGTISMYLDGDATTVVGSIRPQWNISQQAVWTVPRGKSAFIEWWSASISNELYGYTEFGLAAAFDPTDGSPSPGVFIARDIFPVFQGTSPAPRRFDPTPFWIPELVDIWCVVLGIDLKNPVVTRAYATFHGFYEDAH